MLNSILCLNLLDILFVRLLYLDMLAKLLPIGMHQPDFLGYFSPSLVLCFML